MHTSKKQNVFVLVLFFSYIFSIKAIDTEITPHKFSSYEEALQANYIVPKSSIYKANRSEEDAPSLVYYVSKPIKSTEYPLAILCTGSSNRESAGSIIPFHRYFLQQFLDLEMGVVTAEQWGIDSNVAQIDEFMEHYTRTQRLKDHQDLIEELQNNPPDGWNGQLIFLGISEGGLLVTRLSELYSDITIATINLCGAGDWSWRDELWEFLGAMKKNARWYERIIFTFMLPFSRKSFDKSMDNALKSPVFTKEFLGMTYLYHADAETFPDINYNKLITPFLVVAGAEDSLIQSCDLFVDKAEKLRCPITYLRVDGMDHYVRKCPDVLAQVFEWLKAQMV